MSTVPKSMAKEAAASESTTQTKGGPSAVKLAGPAGKGKKLGNQGKPLGAK